MGGRTVDLSCCPSVLHQFRRALRRPIGLPRQSSVLQHWRTRSPRERTGSQHSARQDSSHSRRWPNSCRQPARRRFQRGFHDLERGHRNPQGLTIHPVTHELWETEHGPKGGDELNRILRGRNYGWPLVTHGTNYDGTIISRESERDGLESPRAHWSPSPGVAGLTFYSGDRFPKWRNRLLIATLALQQLKLLRLDNGRVVREDVLLENMGRIRDVAVGPDGSPYVALNQPNGRIYRLVPE